MRRLLERLCVDGFNTRYGRALLTPGQQPIHSFRGAHHLGFHRAITAIARPPHHTEFYGRLLERVSKSHALYSAHHSHRYAYGLHEYSRVRVWQHPGLWIEP